MKSFGLVLLTIEPLLAVEPVYENGMPLCPVPEACTFPPKDASSQLQLAAHTDLCQLNSYLQI